MCANLSHNRHCHCSLFLIMTKWVVWIQQNNHFVPTHQGHKKYYFLFVWIKKWVASIPHPNPICWVSLYLKGFILHKLNLISVPFLGFISTVDSVICIWKVLQRAREVRICIFLNHLLKAHYKSRWKWLMVLSSSLRKNLHLSHYKQT